MRRKLGGCASGDRREETRERRGSRRHSTFSASPTTGEHRHQPLKEQQRKLNEKLRGHDAYYGVTGNYRMLQRLRWEVAKKWRKWLARRNRGNGPNWQQFGSMLRAFPLTPARVIHSTM